MRKETRNAATLQDILYKDAVYDIIGIASSEIYEHINFPSWLNNHLVNELKNDSNPR